MAAVALASVILAPALAQDSPQAPIGEIFASDASVHGAVRLAGSGMQVMSGSSVAAGQATALLHLARGGNIRICPRTSLSISSSPSGRDLMFGISTGAVEAEYTLSASADAILTPDFRILLAGPGAFHVAIGADVRGNTCVRSLDNNTASVIISELMGDGTYQVKPGEQVVFHNGKLAEAEHDVGGCGCGVSPAVLRAATPPPRPIPPPPPKPYREEAPVTAAATPGAPIPDIADLKQVPRPSLSLSPLEPPLPPSPPLPATQPSEVHVQVDAPFYFNANEVAPAPLHQAARLTLSTTPELALIPAPPRPAELTPPPPPPSLQPVVNTRKSRPPKPGGVFGKVRAFFASIFR
jgi:hypothetical protein